MSGVQRLATWRNLSLGAAVVVAAAGGWGLAHVTSTSASVTVRSTPKPSLPTTVPSPPTPVSLSTPTAVAGACGWDPGSIYMKVYKIAPGMVSEFAQAYVQCSGAPTLQVHIDIIFQQQNARGQMVEVGRNHLDTGEINGAVADDQNWNGPGKCSGQNYAVQMQGFLYELNSGQHQELATVNLQTSGCGIAQ
jgi:hypothetical protein